MEPLRIAICVKHVPAGPLRLDPATLRLDRTGDTELNPKDRAAVEAALRLRDAGLAREVFLVSVGPRDAAVSVREGLSMGADRALVLADERASGSDVLATSRLLAELLEHERPSLTFFGQAASDSEGAVLWSAVARRLGQPALSQAVEVHVADRYVTIRRQTEEGHEALRAPLPCVVSVTDAFEPRFPSFREMKTAQGKPVALVDLDQVEIDARLAGQQGSRTEVLAVSRPPPSGRATLILEEEPSTAERVAEFLAERGLI
jgi:electron transfer flavoprotein beta subunit